MPGTKQSPLNKKQEKLAFSERLSYLVKRLGLSDAELSRRSGLPKNTISRYRNAESLPETNHLFTVARALSVDPEWLMTGQGQAQRAADEDNDGQDQQRLMALFAAMDDEARQLMLHLATFIWSRPAPSPAPLLNEPVADFSAAYPDIE